ncbi:MAG: hypothetical protein ACRD0H_18915, partial [Actinomycetes bacterium]
WAAAADQEVREEHKDLIAEHRAVLDLIRERLRTGTSGDNLFRLADEHRPAGVPEPVWLAIVRAVLTPAQFDRSTMTEREWRQLTDTVADLTRRDGYSKREWRHVTHDTWNAAADEATRERHADLIAAHHAVLDTIRERVTGGESVAQLLRLADEHRPNGVSEPVWREIVRTVVTTDRGDPALTRYTELLARTQAVLDQLDKLRVDGVKELRVKLERLAHLQPRAGGRTPKRKWPEFLQWQSSKDEAAAIKARITELEDVVKQLRELMSGLVAELGGRTGMHHGAAKSLGALLDMLGAMITAPGPRTEHQVRALVQIAHLLRDMPRTTDAMLTLQIAMRNFLHAAEPGAPADALVERFSDQFGLEWDEQTRAEVLELLHHLRERHDGDQRPAWLLPPAAPNATTREHLLRIGWGLQRAWQRTRAGLAGLAALLAGLGAAAALLGMDPTLSIAGAIVAMLAGAWIGGRLRVDLRGRGPPSVLRRILIALASTAPSAAVLYWMVSSGADTGVLVAAATAAA